MLGQGWVKNTFGDLAVFPGCTPLAIVSTMILDVVCAQVCIVASALAPGCHCLERARRCRVMRVRAILSHGVTHGFGERLVVLASIIRVVESWNVEPRRCHSEFVLGMTGGRCIARCCVDIAPRVTAPRLVGVEVVGRPQLIAPFERTTLMVGANGGCRCRAFAVLQ